MNNQTESEYPALKHSTLFFVGDVKNYAGRKPNWKSNPSSDGLERIPRSRDYAIFPRYLNRLDTIIYIQFYQNIFAVVIDRINAKIEFVGNFFA